MQNEKIIKSIAFIHKFGNIQSQEECEEPNRVWRNGCRRVVIDFHTSFRPALLVTSFFVSEQIWSRTGKSVKVRRITQFSGKQSIFTRARSSSLTFYSRSDDFRAPLVSLIMAVAETITNLQLERRAGFKSHAHADRYL
jgi:hypothetical protein